MGIDMNSQDRLRQILTEYRHRLEEALGDNLEPVILYGSRARGEAVEGSDIDVLCVMKEPFDYRACQSPFFMNVRREGIPL